MKILSFTHPQVVPNMYECLCSAEHKGRYSEEWVLGHHWLPQHFLSYYGSQWCPKTAWLQTFFKIPLCSAEQRNSYMFGTTWGWINYDTIFIFGWTFPLKSTWDQIQQPATILICNIPLNSQWKWTWLQYWLITIFGLLQNFEQTDLITSSEPIVLLKGKHLKYGNDPRAE